MMINLENLQLIHIRCLRSLLSIPQKFSIYSSKIDKDINNNLELCEINKLNDIILYLHSNYLIQYKIAESSLIEDIKSSINLLFYFSQLIIVNMIEIYEDDEEHRTFDESEKVFKFLIKCINGNDTVFNHNEYGKMLKKMFKNLFDIIKRSIEYNETERLNRFNGRRRKKQKYIFDINKYFYKYGTPHYIRLDIKRDTFSFCLEMIENCLELS